MKDRKRRTDFKDLSGKVFGNLTVISHSHTRINIKSRSQIWNCKCSCGVIKEISGGSLASKRVISCGCYNAARVRTHGMTKSKEYSTWFHLKRRAAGKQKEVAKYYENKGIDERWVKSFQAFLDDMGLAPSKEHSIDRIDNSKGYFKENCRWATSKEQNRNLTNNRMFTHNGQTKCMSEWAEITGISPQVISYRLDAKWADKDIFKKAHKYNRKTNMS